MALLPNFDMAMGVADGDPRRALDSARARFEPTLQGICTAWSSSCLHFE